VFKFVDCSAVFLPGLDREGRGVVGSYFLAIDEHLDEDIQLLASGFLEL